MITEMAVVHFKECVVIHLKLKKDKNKLLLPVYVLNGNLN
jgi:hypothetical protein